MRLLNQRDERVMQRLQQHKPADFALCSVVKADLLYGARHSRQVEANLRLLAKFFQPLVGLPFDDRCADEAGLIRADQAAQGRLIGRQDLLIAATARAYDVVMVTPDTGKFARITGLRLEDWDDWESGPA